MNALAVPAAIRLPAIIAISLSLYVIALATSMSGMELFASLLVVLVLAYWVGKGAAPKLLETPLLWPLLSFVLIAWTGTLLSPDAWKDKAYDLQRMRFFFLFVFLYYAIKIAGTRFKWEQTLLAICLFIAAYGTIQHFYGVDWFRPEGKKIILYAVNEGKIGPLVIGSFNHHLTFVNVFLMSACLFTCWGLSSLKQRWPLFVLGLWLFLLCVWTQSRTGWIVIAIALSLIAYRKSKRALLGTWVVLALVAMALFSFDPGFRGRIEKTFITQDEAYAPQSRMRLWHANWELFKSHPLIGVGYNNNERHAKEIVDSLYPATKDTNFYGHAHSNVLQLLATTGILGFLAYLWIWFEVFKRCRLWIRHATSTYESWTAYGVLVGFIGFHLQGLTQWNFGDAEVLHNLLFFWALTASRSDTRLV